MHRKSYIYFYIVYYTLGYQVISRHKFLKMLTGTRADEDESYDNMIICISVSTVLMVFIIIMEALTYFLYNNKVQRLHFKRPNMPSYFAVPSKKRDY